MTTGRPALTQPSAYTPPPRIRVLALALILHPRTQAILVNEFQDASGRVLHRPLGGGIEFGETAEQALRRELAEELRADIEVGEQLTVVENIFTFNDVPGHEWIVLLRAQLMDDRLLQQGPFPILDAPQDVAVWRPVPAPTGSPPLVPAAIATDLATWTGWR